MSEEKITVLTGWDRGLKHPLEDKLLLVDILLDSIPDFQWPGGYPEKMSKGIRFGAPRMHSTPPRKHLGIDAQYNKPGDLVHAAFGGTVRYSAYWKGAGNTVCIGHDFKGVHWSTSYLHLEVINTNIKVGQEVGKGDVIGKVGNTGTRSEGSTAKTHTHFEVHYSNGIKRSYNVSVRVDPEAILGRRSSEQTMIDEFTSGGIASSGSNTSTVVSSLPTEPNILAQFALVPNNMLIQPPRCNVIFPCMNMSVDMSRNFLQEPTRAIAYTKFNKIPHVFMTPSEIYSQGVRKSVVAPKEKEGEVLDIGSPTGGGAAKVELAFGEPNNGKPSDGFIFSSTVGASVLSIADGIVIKVQYIEDDSFYYTDQDKDKLSVKTTDNTKPTTIKHNSDGKDHWIYSKGKPSGDKALGNLIHIKFDSYDYIVKYNHLLSIKSGLKINSKVAVGDIIGFVGATGMIRTANIGLHIDVTKSGNKPVNTSKWFGQPNTYGDKILPEEVPSLKITTLPDLIIKGIADPGGDSTTIQESDDQKTTQEESDKTAVSAQSANAVALGEPDYKYLTPEERRKGMIVGVLEFYNTALTINSMTSNDGNIGGLSAEDMANLKKRMPNVTSPDMSAKTSDKVGSNSGYMSKMLHGWWLKSRYEKRSISTSPGVFNPWIVAGLPGLILDPIRSIIAQIETVNHSIDMRGSASTAISMSSPRYWDEGDPLHWIGGEKNDSTRNFHSWMNQNFIAANDNAALDNVYLYFVGGKAIEYSSVNKGKKSSLTRNPFTNAIIDYNNKIDGRTGSRRTSGTIASNYFNESTPDKKETHARSYVERDIVTEKELMVDFMKCKSKRTEHDGPNYIGGCFTNYERYTGSSKISNSGEYNDVQKHVIDYINDIIHNTVRSEQ